MVAHLSPVTAIMFTALTTAAHAAKATRHALCWWDLGFPPPFLPEPIKLSLLSTVRFPHLPDFTKAIKLPQVISADGGRYADGDMGFWIKGKDNASIGRSG